MKTCTSCKFHARDLYYRDLCTRNHTSKMVADPVQGGTKEVDTSNIFKKWLRCEDERQALFFGCGSKARYHKPRFPA
ncbi:hypothetical protein [Luteibacter sp. 22Crub2.1]|uniref:hypothetical protein n=1 Tax=Luteibacter sp. 22Crub2.1 TaxID=1283288 RepID=UPI0009A69185|nr:hypothetical protein [Luteibacter sp. 22Crub2.1]SKB50525.1 hypothetical protein SAMN05660880_01356 [Luteibacter sp. 22Crub2.1]